MNIAHFLSRLPKILDPIKSQILASQDLSSLSEVLVEAMEVMTKKVVGRGMWPS